MADFDFEEIKKIKVLRKTLDLEVELKEVELKGKIAEVRIHTEMAEETQADLHYQSIDSALELTGATKEQRQAYWRANPPAILQGINLDEVFKEPKPAGAAATGKSGK